MLAIATIGVGLKCTYSAYFLPGLVLGNRCTSIMYQFHFQIDGWSRDGSILLFNDISVKSSRDVKMYPIIPSLLPLFVYFFILPSLLQPSVLFICLLCLLSFFASLGPISICIVYYYVSSFSKLSLFRMMYQWSLVKWICAYACVCVCTVYFVIIMCHSLYMRY